MAEVVGLAASVIQIGGAGAKLSIELYNFISTASRADSEISYIAGDVELTSKVLGNVGKVLEADDAKKLVNQEAIQHAKDLIKQCEEVFNELSDVVEKARKTGKDGKMRVGFRAKMGWPMKELRVELLRRRLETLKSSLLVLFYVLQLAQDKAKGDIEAASLEEQRKNIRELHQQQQDSLRILKALERKFNADEGVSSQSSNMPVSNLGIFATSTATSLSPIAHEQLKRNQAAMDLFNNLESDTSDSETINSDNEGEHLTLDELAVCAAQVQKLLRRIVTLQESLKTGQTGEHLRKRRMHKVYQRFCRKFEANIVNFTSVPPLKADSKHIVAGPPPVETISRPTHPRRQSVQSAQSTRNTSQTARRITLSSRRPTIEQGPTITYVAPRRRDNRNVEKCTLPGCTRCGTDAIEQRPRQSRRQSMLPTQRIESAPDVSYPHVYDTRLLVSDSTQYGPSSPRDSQKSYHTRADLILQPGISRRQSTNSRQARSPGYRVDAGLRLNIASYKCIEENDSGSENESKGDDWLPTLQPRQRKRDTTPILSTSPTKVQSSHVTLRDLCNYDNAVPANNEKPYKSNDKLPGKGEGIDCEQGAEPRNRTKTTSSSWAEDQPIAQRETQSVKDKEGKQAAESAALNNSTCTGRRGPLAINTILAPDDVALENFDFDSFLHIGEPMAVDEPPPGAPSNEQKGYTMEHYQEELKALEQRGKERLAKTLQERQQQASGSYAQVQNESPKKQEPGKSMLRHYQTTVEDHFSDNDVQVRFEAPNPTHSFSTPSAVVFNATQPLLIRTSPDIMTPDQDRPDDIMPLVQSHSHTDEDELCFLASNRSHDLGASAEVGSRLKDDPPQNDEIDIVDVLLARWTA